MHRLQFYGFAIMLILLISLTGCKENAETQPPATDTTLPAIPTPASTLTSEPTVAVSTGATPTFTGTVTPTQTSESSTPTSVPTHPFSSPLAQIIAGQCLTAMSNVTYYQLGNQATNKYDTFEDNYSTQETTNYNANTSVDIANQAMKIHDSYQIYDNLGSKIASKPDSYWYISDGWVYSKNLNTNIWSRAALTDQIWTAENQINWPLKFMNSASGLNIIDNQTINGVDCYILSFTPSLEVMHDWAQFLSSSTGFLPWSTGPSLSGDILLKTYKSGVCQFWISKSSDLVMQVNFQAHYETTPVDFPQLDPKYNFIKFTSDFRLQMTFSSYNLQVDIQLPPEALNAVEK